MANKSNSAENLRIGRLLKHAREKGGLLQSDMIDVTGLSKNHISAVERGVSKPSVECLLGYCNKLEVTPNDILGFTDYVILPELTIELARMDDSQQRRILEIARLISNERIKDK